MDSAHDTRRQLGQLMVEEGFLTDEQLSQALAEQGRTGRPLGKVLVDLGFVSPGAVANALAEQHGGLLRTEYGTSAGLREVAAQGPIRPGAVQAPAPPSAFVVPQAAAPASPLGSGLRLAPPDTGQSPAVQPAVEAPAPAELPAPTEPAEQPEPLALEPPEPTERAEPAEPVGFELEGLPSAAAASSARIEELESQFHDVVNERNSLAQSLNELQARLTEAAQAHEAAISAEVTERVSALESSLQVASTGREESDRAQQLSALRIAELEAQLQSAAAERSEVEELSSTQIQELERQLHELRAADDHDDGRRAAETDALRAQLQEVTEHRDAAEFRTIALENDLTALRSELESLREQPVGADAGLADRVAELSEALHTASAERNAARERVAALGPELAALRSRVETVAAERDAARAGRAGTDPEAGALREQLATRERRLAESVGEIAKMNREHRALLQLVERQFQLEETTTALPEPKGEAAHVLFVPSVNGYTLLEQDGATPEAGDVVELEWGRFVVRRLGPSPLPGPRRRCAYLERA